MKSIAPMIDLQSPSIKNELERARRLSSSISNKRGNKFGTLTYFLLINLGVSGLALLFIKFPKECLITTIIILSISLFVAFFYLIWDISKELSGRYNK